MNQELKDRIYTIKDWHLYAAITLSSYIYACFIVTDAFYYRVIAFVFAFAFLALLPLYILERRHSFFKPNGVQARIWFFLFTFLTLIPLAYSIQGDPRSLVTLAFHPLAFLAFFISVVALTVTTKTKDTILKFSSIVNNCLPFAIVADYLFNGKPAGINELHFFLFIEIIFYDQLKKRRRLYLLLLVLAIIVLQVIADNRMVAIRLIVVSSALIGFKMIPFLANKALRFIALVGGIILFYLLAFEFESTFQFFTDYLQQLSIDPTDTRSFLYVEFFEDFKGLDWLGGKGYMGSYFSPWFYEWQGDDGDHFQRFSIEVGALEFLLKGGLLLLIPFYLLLIGCLFIGFVKAPVNSAAFRFSVFLLVQFMITSIENSPMFSINYMLIWLSMGIIIVDTTMKKKKVPAYVGNL
ncbi:MAG TPA: hypothetical protein VIK80_07055 [Flavihumibacter sp.]